MLIIENELFSAFSQGPLNTSEHISHIVLLEDTYIISEVINCPSDSAVLCRVCNLLQKVLFRDICLRLLAPELNKLQKVYSGVTMIISPETAKGRSSPTMRSVSTELRLIPQSHGFYRRRIQEDLGRAEIFSKFIARVLITERYWEVILNQICKLHHLRRGKVSHSDDVIQITLDNLGLEGLFGSTKALGSPWLPAMVSFLGRSSVVWIFPILSSHRNSCLKTCLNLSK